MTVSVDLEPPRRALAIGAHADDIEFGAGATLAKWAAAGTEVHLCVCTDGSKGTWDGAADLGALVARREEEQRDAAAALGAKGVKFLRFIDGELDHGLVARAAVCRVIRTLQPDVVVGHDPWQQYRIHPDHHHAGLLAIDSIVAARDPHFFPEQEMQPHRPRLLLCFEAARVSHLESVDGFVDRKIAALLAHRSQWRSTMGIGDESGADLAAFERAVGDDARAQGLRAGLRAAEAFARIDDL
jgi:LmbE family N-acetylglucosaminyl deacetylase